MHDQDLNDFTQKHSTTSKMVIPPSSTESSSSDDTSHLKRSRGWLVTTHIWAKKAESTPRLPLTTHPNLRYVKDVLEVGEEYILDPSPERYKTNVHGQVAVYFHQPVNYITGKIQLYGDRDHCSNWKPVNNFPKTIAYCDKTFVYDRPSDKVKYPRCYEWTKQEAGHWLEDRLEWGEPPSQGKRHDLDSVAAMIEEGMTEREIVDILRADGYSLTAQVWTSLNNLKRIYSPCRIDHVHKQNVSWFYGPSESGKTTQAEKFFKDAKIRYFKIGSSDNWENWQNYDGEEGLILDDIRSYRIPLDQLLGVIYDKDATRNAKYGIRKLNVKYVIITAPSRPDVVYANERHESMLQLFRRIGRIVQFESVLTPAQQLPQEWVYNGESYSPKSAELSITSADFCAFDLNPLPPSYSLQRQSPHLKDVSETEPQLQSQNEFFTLAATSASRLVKSICNEKPQDIPC